MSWIDFLPLALIVLAVILVYSSGRNRKLKCPECGTVFDAPVTDSNRSGTGWTIPNRGTVRCPKCGKSRPRREYPRVKVKEPQYTGTIRQEDTATP